MDQPWQWLSDLLFGEPPTDTNPSDTTQGAARINMPAGDGRGQRYTIHQAEADGS